jgi:hypothetical protein
MDAPLESTLLHGKTTKNVLSIAGTTIAELESPPAMMPIAK